MPENPRPCDIYRRLKSFAKRRYGTIKNLAEHIGVPYDSILNTYRRSIPGGKFLLELHKAGCDIVWLLTGSEEHIAMPPALRPPLPLLHPHSERAGALTPAHRTDFYDKP